MFRPIAFAALLAYASAQSLSSSCTSALTSIAGNSDAAACLSPASLVTLVAGGSNTSVITPINNWLTNLCAAPACSNATIAAIVQNVTTGCQSDLSPLGFSSSLTSSITSLIQQYYPTARKILCLKDGDTNCVTQTLNNVQKAVGIPLTIPNLVNVTSSDAFNLSDPTITCTNCIKEAYNILSTDVPSLVSDTAPSLQSQCGASFTDGQTPSGILQTASNSSASTATQSKAAAIGSFSMISNGVVTGLAAVSAIVVSTLFTFLA